ncbi:hypothetical protein ZIOFF_028263 [Zingiber officinale]|uniref:Uncharacterized protein n=1 Tax=Zingiber officinale TaxID=94328 RepID=A0A8J5L8V9_ZINOF|nr:hypothetical protein ZIOFF_028263 [Zingiber officinale]
MPGGRYRACDRNDVDRPIPARRLTQANLSVRTAASRTGTAAASTASRDGSSGGKRWQPLQAAVGLGESNSSPCRPETTQWLAEVPGALDARVGALDAGIGGAGRRDDSSAFLYEIFRPRWRRREEHTVRKNLAPRRRKEAGKECGRRKLGRDGRGWRRKTLCWRRTSGLTAWVNGMRCRRAPGWRAPARAAGFGGLTASASAASLFSLAAGKTPSPRRR